MSFIDVVLVVAFLFFVGSVFGWCLEVLFRRFFTAKKWINPGFLTGPYLPLYGFGVAGLFGISRIPLHTGYAWLDAVLLILIMGVTMTLIEYIAGLIFIKGMKIKLWDYSNRWGNIQGIICPLFSFFWLAVSAAFYFVIDTPVLEAVTWFTSNIWFAFFVGIFFGVFLVDLGCSLHLATRIKKFAGEHGIIVHLEKFKETLFDKRVAAKQKVAFAFPLEKMGEFREQLASVKEKFTARMGKKKRAAGAVPSGAPQGPEASAEIAPASDMPPAPANASEVPAPSATEAEPPEAPAPSATEAETPKSDK